MIAVTLPHPRSEAEPVVGPQPIGSQPIVATHVVSADRLAIGPSPAAAPGFEPAVFAVVISGAPTRAVAPLERPRSPPAVLDELVAVLERHFGGRVRVADLALSHEQGDRLAPTGPESRSPTFPAPLRYGRLAIDGARHEVLVDERPTPLTKSEFDLLSVLVRRPGVVHSRREIVVACKGPNYPVDDRSIDVQMFNLRRKLGPVGRRLQTVRSVGYRFTPEGT